MRLDTSTPSDTSQPRARTTRRRRTVACLGVAALAVIAACGDNASDQADETATPTSTAPTVSATDEAAAEATRITPPDTTPPDSTPAPTTTTVAEPTETTITKPASDEWIGVVEQSCVGGADSFASLALTEPSLEGVETWVAGWRAAPLATPDLPAGTPEFVTEVGNLDESAAAATAVLDEAESLAKSGDLDGALDAVDRYEDIVLQRAGAVAVAGGRCAIFGPEHIEGTRLNVPVLGGWHIGSGFGSIWVSRQFGANHVERIDPDTGEIVATIDVGSRPIKLQAADGRIWVRTEDTFVAIDPETNEVAATIAKSDVGPGANRSWAVDGALWICDGLRLHRYDPTTLQPVTVIELDTPCGHPYATDDLVVVWNHNDDAGESGTEAAALIDPSTNTVLHTVSLPFDVHVPVVLDDVVYFPGNNNDSATIVDRTTGAVSEAPASGRILGGSQPAFDGTSIYVVARPSLNDSRQEIVVVDAETFEVTDVIPNLGVNSLEMLDGTLWTANPLSGFVQAFDRPASAT